MARIIINGDDFGMNVRCSRAIAEAFAKGLITDTTAMANGEWLAEALMLARERRFDDRIGVHLNLTEGKPLTEKISGVPAFVTDGCFNKCAMRLDRELTDAEYEAVYTELKAQILRLQSMGITITHADSHHYIHNSPYFLPVVIQVCREQGINKIRLRRNLPVTSAAVAAENNAYHYALHSHGFITTEYFGRPEDIAERKIPGCTELLVHPDYDRENILIDRRGVSDGFPIGERLPDISKTSGVELISYSVL